MNEPIFQKKYVTLKSKVRTQLEAFEEMAALAKKAEIIDDEAALVAGFQHRETEATTGFTEGFAIPHCRVATIKKAAVLFTTYEQGIEWDSLDGSLVTVAIALLVPEDKAGEIHLALLGDLARQLIDQKTRDGLKKAASFVKIKELLFPATDEEPTSASASENKTAPVAKTIDNKLPEKTAKKQKIVGVTACPTGVAHTYMAADYLTKEAKELGYDIKIETQGSQGVGNALTQNDIETADVVIIAADIGVATDRFSGKKVYSTRVATAIKDPAALIQDAFAKGVKQKANLNPFSMKSDLGGGGGGRKGIMTHLMSGLSYLIPIVILGGIFIALANGLLKSIYGPNAIFAGDKPQAQGNQFNISSSNFLNYLNDIGAAAFTLMIPILGAMIANSIAGRAAIAPALVVSYIGNTPSSLFPIVPGYKPTTPTGFMGAILAGIAIGYIVLWINKTWKVPKNLRPIMPIFVIPILVGGIGSLIMIFAIGGPISYIMHEFQNFIQTYWKGSITSGSGGAAGIAVGLGFGLLIGAMAGFDMGGPINKVAFLSSVALLGSGVYQPMGAMAAAIPVAPLGMGLTTVIFRKLFNQDQKTLGGTALLMGAIGISEGAIPFAVNDPKRAIACNVVGSAVAGGVAGLIGITDIAAHGGLIVGLIGALGRSEGINQVNNTGWSVNGWYWTLIAMAIMAVGALITCFMYGSWLIIDRRLKGEDISLNPFHKERKAGTGVLGSLKEAKAPTTSAKKNGLAWKTWKDRFGKALKTFKR